jgi:UDP-glucose 6-dehydrogenase
MKYKLGVVGCGFVGTAVSTGFQTVLKDKVEIREYDKFKDTESLETVVEESDILFLCLPTPMNDDGSCNTSIIEEVVRDISMITFQRKLLVIKSTVPPGTTNKFQEKYPKLDFCFNPEFLTQANFINDFIKQDRIFLGWPEKPKFDMKNYLRIKNLYQDFNAKRLNDGTVVSILSSEGLAKDVEISFL